MWKIVFTKKAVDDLKKITESGLKPKLQKLLEILEENLFKTPPNFEKLRGDLIGTCSRRINIKHRLVYQVIEEEKIVKIIRAWTHYE